MAAGSGGIGNETEETVRVLMFSDVLTLAGDRIRDVTAFVVRLAEVPDGYSRWPERQADPQRIQSVFQRFGLPDRID